MDDTSGSDSGSRVVRLSPSEETLRKRHNESVLAKKKKQEEAARAGTPSLTEEESLKSVLVAMVKSQAILGKTLLELARRVESIGGQLNALESSVVEELRFLSEVVLCGPAPAGPGEMKESPQGPSQE
jgi:hypothetical protein